MKKTFADRWYWFVSHVGLPLVILVCIWMCVSFITGYPFYYWEIWNYIELAVANVFCVLLYFLYVLFCVVCMIKLLKRHENWKFYLNIQLLLLPLVVSVSYEINRLVGRYDNWLTRLLTAPGMWFQNFTTNEPDDDMIEVAIAALEAVLPENEGEDRW